MDVVDLNSLWAKHQGNVIHMEVRNINMHQHAQKDQKDQKAYAGDETR